eukprot:1159139-Pelagomonas_calceolata.AAC.12
MQTLMYPPCHWGICCERYALGVCYLNDPASIPCCPQAETVKKWAFCTYPTNAAPYACSTGTGQPVCAHQQESGCSPKKHAAPVYTHRYHHKDALPRLTQQYSWTKDTFHRLRLFPPFFFRGFLAGELLMSAAYLNPKAKALYGSSRRCACSQTRT